MLGQLTLSTLMLAGGMTLALAEPGGKSTTDAPGAGSSKAGTMMMKGPAAKAKSPSRTTTGRASPRGGTATQNAPGAGGTSGVSTSGAGGTATAPGSTATGEASPKGGKATQDAPGAGGTSASH